MNPWCWWSVHRRVPALRVRGADHELRGPGAAQSVVLSVRRQFRDHRLMEGKADPDYARRVDLCTVAEA